MILQKWFLYCPFPLLLLPSAVSSQRTTFLHAYSKWEMKRQRTRLQTAALWQQEGRRRWSTRLKVVRGAEWMLVESMGRHRWLWHTSPFHPGPRLCGTSCWASSFWSCIRGSSLWQTSIPGRSFCSGRGEFRLLCSRPPSRTRASTWWKGMQDVNTQTLAFLAELYYSVFRVDRNQISTT